MKAYIHPNVDGTYSEMVAAQNQKEACKLFKCSEHDFRKFGGHALPKAGASSILANSSPGTVFRRDLRKIKSEWFEAV